MILAAGLGTRLRPLTDKCPKALVEVGGRTMLEITILRLQAAGVRQLIVNVHHFAEMVVDYLRANANFGVQVEISREDILLDTGGGLKKAGWFFLEDKSRMEEPFFVHNVDILSAIDLGLMARRHAELGAIATLAVQKRQSSRYLLFDDKLRLCGRRAGENCEPEIARATNETQALGFCGIHVISPRFLGMIKGQGAFSIIESYLQAVRGGETVSAFPAEQYYWRDLGKVEQVRRAEEDLRRGIVR
jgi:mannose-1-phosphate guanylyltransferase